MFVNLSQQAKMAPKPSQPRKRPAYRGSSSSSGNFDAQRFQSLSKETSFENTFSKKQVLVERPVILDRINIDFRARLLQREWSSLYIFDCGAYGSLVREFYNNIYDIGQKSFKSYVRGTIIEIDSNSLTQFLQIDRSLDAIYPTPKPDSDDINDRITGIGKRLLPHSPVVVDRNG